MTLTPCCCLPHALLQHVMRAVCKHCLPSSPLPPTAFASLVPVLNHILSASPATPLLQPCLSLLVLHGDIPSDALSVVDAAYDNATATGGDGVAVTLSDALTTEVSLNWKGAGAIADALNVASWYVALNAPAPVKHTHARVIDGEEEEGEESGASQGTSADAAAAPDAVQLLHGYLVQRDSRARAITGLLDAVAIAPKGHPSPAAALRCQVTGMEDADAETTVASTLDILETGA